MVVEESIDGQMMTYLHGGLAIRQVEPYEAGHRKQT